MAPIAAPQQAPEKMIEILLAGKALPMGKRLATDDIIWANWPEAHRPPNSITRTERPTAIEDFQGVLVRQNIVPGETVTSDRFILDKTKSFLSALLLPGMRAVAIPATPVDTAGGFILPGDRVDILQVVAGANGKTNAEPLITNVKVLAVGNETREPEGQKTILGSTLTVEVFPDQAELIARVQKLSGLTMSLRPFSGDTGQSPETPKPDQAAKKEEQAIRIIRNGVVTSPAR
ncbi:Flp pilus assembly protein CpaB [Camelimonas fluminis]|nr:Flp pilus assembly protein CpaB [Camelimonas fluminis]